MKQKSFALVALILVAAMLLSACSGPLGTVRQLVSRVETAAGGPEVVSTAQPVEAAVQISSTTAQAQPAPIEGDVLEALQSRLETIYATVNPSVVNIQVVGSGGSAFQGLPQMPGLPTDPNQPNLPTQQALGSGFVWDKLGHIVTNNHVVDGATEITVKFSDDTTVPAKVVGTDPDSDLAVIKVDLPADQLQPVEVADSTSLQVGQLAVAIGNPFGLEGTMTVGFVSALGRSLPVEARSAAGQAYTIPDVIQTDAPINPGNSGGVLVDDNGHVIGVTTAIESRVGQNAGIGFAVPSAIVTRVVPALIANGSFEHTWLGISGTTLTPDLAGAMKLDANQHGALVISVTAGSPAEKAGLRGSDQQVDINGQQAPVGGDVIVAIDGQPVKHFDDLVAYLAGSTSVGDKVLLTVVRDGKEQSLDVTLEARPGSAQPQSRAGTGSATGAAWLGIEGMDVTPEIAQAMDLAKDQTGILVGQVVANGSAAQAGLEAGLKSLDLNGQQIKVGGDIIIAADGQSIGGMQDLRAFLARAEPGQQVTLTLLRGGKELEVDVTLGERPDSNQ